ncbi:hypothetical protein [Leptospira meyeri]|uniref:hypothetical protein n=1 Tax=Leptospira meyeri TaxID=29508 RepID=UPI0010835E59|nr:hypothetical protein [Leptospira meyeri]TGM22002.1 hypothetical protein EHQ73_09405 [Leptospira meyeri]
MENVVKEKAIQEYVKAVAEFQVRKAEALTEQSKFFIKLAVKQPLLFLFLLKINYPTKVLEAIRTAPPPLPPIFFKQDGVVKN